MTIVGIPPDDPDQVLRTREDAPPPADLVPQSNSPSILSAAQTARPELVGHSGQAIPVGRHAAIPGYVDPDTNGQPGAYNPPNPIGVAQLASKAENIHNPILRALAKVGAYGARAIDTAGTIVAPRIAAAIPGSTVNERLGEARQRAINVEDTETGLKTAQTREANANADAKDNAQPKPGTPDEQVLAAGTRIAQGVGTKEDMAVVKSFHDLNQAKQEAKPTPEGEKAVTDSNQINQINAERAQQWHVMHPNAPLDSSYMAKVGDTEKSIKEQDERFGRLGGAEGTAATREATEAQRKIANQQHADTEADRKAQRAEGDATRKNQQSTALKEKAITYWQPALDSAERVNVMSKNYREGVDNHNQQAMLSLLANHLGMTMGLQKGARLTKDIVNEAKNSAPWLQTMKAKFDKDGYLSGVNLTPEQMKQMVDLGFERYREDVKKARSMAGYIGVSDEPPRHISKESAAYYVEGSGGDPAKARQMATEDGWTF